MRIFKQSVAIVITTLFLCISYAEKLSPQIGDIVLRAGITTDSLIIQKLGQVRYSHIGLITQTDPVIIVTHSTTNDNPNLPNQVIETPLNEFVSAQFSQNHRIIRPNFLSDTEKQQLALNVQQQVGKTYVLKSREEENLYCTTLLEQPLLQLRPNLELKWHTINFGPFHGEYLFPDTFMDIKGMQTIEVSDPQSHL